MKKTTLFITLIALAIFGFGLNWAISSTKESEREKRSKVDFRIDNMVYWMKMAEKGYVPYNPDTKVPAATYKGSKIRAFSVLTEDSPDVPVTEINSTQSENSIFVDPTNNSVILNSNNSTPNPSGGNVYGASGLFSFDAAESWEGEVQSTAGDDSGDPTTAIGLNGRWYVNYISSSLGQGVSYSDDQGANWTAKTIAPSGGGILDKNHMWIDNSPESPYEGNLYAAWTSFASANYNKIVMTHSTDDGETWSNGVNISADVNAGSHDQGVNISTGPNGEVYAVWAIYDNSSNLDESAIGMAKSLDGGATWEPAVRIIDDIRGIRDTETSTNMRVNSFPAAAVDCSKGNDQGAIYVCWANVGVPGINTGNDIDVYLIKSVDQGDTWSDPIRVNQDPIDQGKEHYSPWIAVDPSNGIVSLVFYDNRNVPPGQTEVFCANSNDGAETWEDFQVSDVAFTPQPIAGLASNYMGDYLGIIALDGMVYPCWTDNRSGSCMTYVSPYETNSLSKPANLTAMVTFETGASNLTWSFEEAPDFIEFNVYRGGVLIGNTTDTTYADMLPAYGVYKYQVSASYPDDAESGAAFTSVQWGDAHIAVDPLSIYETLVVDSMSQKYIMVANTGQLELYYDISAFVDQKASSPQEYCEASGGGDEYIGNVKLGDIDNPTAYSPTGYGDYTDLSTSMTVGSNYEIEVENGNGYDLDQCGVWIDWDNNEIFDEEMIVMEGSPGSGPYTATITPPFTAKTASVRMRVRVRYTGDLEPCGSSFYGEVEDYTINVQGWFGIDPVMDTIQAGDTAMVAIDFDATGQLPGIYMATAKFYSNDPDVDAVDVQLTLEVVDMMVVASLRNDLDEICYGAETQIIATPYGSISSPTYEWTSDPEGFISTEQNPMVMPEMSTWYHVTMTDDTVTSVDSVYLTILPLPVIPLGADSIVCGNTIVELDAGPDGLKYLWSTGAETRTIEVDSTTGFNGYGLREISVAVYGLNGCNNADTVVYEFMNCTGIDELKNNISVNIYPNPNEGEFNIDLSAIEDDVVEILITNQVGALVYKQEGIEVRGNKSLRINLEDHASGIYQLTLRGKKSLVTKKVISK